VEEYWRNFDELSKLLISDLQTLGAVAHSVRAVDIQDIVSLHLESKRRNIPFHMHLEEQIKEIEDTVAATGVYPMKLLLDNLSVDSNFTAVHCTHSKPELMKTFVEKGANVCICPLTEVCSSFLFLMLSRVI
jgi:formimidoylglutamate deiminase